MKIHKMMLPAGLALLAVVPAGAAPQTPGADRQKYEIVVDSEGVMRRSDNGREVSYYGTNYTAPFAYSYRALGYEGKDRKQAIDRDIYHISRMGLNAFRLHLWDAELADSLGNLLSNDHLDLLDYTIAQFEKRGIDIILTAQTNFGNGYPEKDADTGSFTYDYDKCKIHEDPKAQVAQARYLEQLARHRNPYTGRTYARDKAIIGIEINNEPCHQASKEQVTKYIDRMSAALRKGGFNRIILYNVTHNPEVTPAYYDAKDIRGTTYQWYPTGLVAGHQRQGNFLPALDNYTIPWEDSIPNYKKLARVVYEFDPADVLYSHLYPAIARTFRQKGFQWITQFAYDPIDLAQYNTEYPTHFMNLAYTPAKALSMMIAVETAKETPRGADYGKYPDNTTFGHTTVSNDPDLSIFNAPEKFIYTNNTDAQPVDVAKLQLVAGHGSSPLVRYDGSGAYFLDKTSQSGVWRLEVLPDISQLEDPFNNTSLNNAKIVTVSRRHPISINLPQLGNNYSLYNVKGENGAQKLATASDATLEITPGTWLLAQDGVTPDFKKLATQIVAGNVGMTEYVAPDPARVPVALLTARRNGDANLDTGMIPEAWDFDFRYVNPNWYDPEHYKLDIKGNHDKSITVVRRRVADKIAAVPEEIHPKVMNVELLAMDPSQDYQATDIPEGAVLAVVSRNGYTYSAPLKFTRREPTANIPAATALASVRISDFAPAKGYIIPAPYPVTVIREVPKTDIPLGDFRNIEFVELIIPSRRQKILLKDIYIE